MSFSAEVSVASLHYFPIEFLRKDSVSLRRGRFSPKTFSGIYFGGQNPETGYFCQGGDGQLPNDQAQSVLYRASQGWSSFMEKIFRMGIGQI